MRHWALGLLLILVIPLHAQRLPAGDTPSNSLLILPPKEEWVTLQSTAFFRKPTTLIEHRELAELRGILSTKKRSLKRGQTLRQGKQLKKVCSQLPRTYSASRKHAAVRAKVVQAAIPYCRVHVKDQEGLVIEQLVFVEEHSQGQYITHTATFFYPASSEEKASRIVTHFARSAVMRGDNG